MKKQTDTPSHSEFSQDQTYIFRLRPEDGVGRLDKILAQLMPEYSRSRLQKWIDEKSVWVNGELAKVRQTVGPDDIIQVVIQPLDEVMAYEAQEIPLDIVAQSPSWLVINKPVGLVTHPGAGNWSGTLLNGLLFHFPELAQVPRAGIVHRLDKDTSGLLVVARTIEAQIDLVRQLQARTVGRHYLALVKGNTQKQGEVTESIGRDSRVPVRMSCRNPIAPKFAKTYYENLMSGIWHGKVISQLRCRLETGRTHQIRVHMSYLGHPLLGDSLYGGPDWAMAHRQMLHAQELHFEDPDTQSLCSFVAPVPEDMQRVLDEVVWDGGSDGKAI